MSREIRYLRATISRFRFGQAPETAFDRLNVRPTRTLDAGARRLASEHRHMARVRDITQALTKFFSVSQTLCGRTPNMFAIKSRAIASSPNAVHVE
jgi:hypothetical protein